MNNETQTIADDMLHGALAIADFLGLPRRTIYHAVSKGNLPVIRIGETIMARKSTLMDWLSRKEMESVGL